MRYTVFVNATNVLWNASFFDHDEMNLRFKVELEYESEAVPASKFIQDIQNQTTHDLETFIIYDPIEKDRRPPRHVKQFKTISSLNEYGVFNGKDEIQLYVQSLPFEYDFLMFVVNKLPIQFVSNNCTKMIDHFAIEWIEFDSTLIEYCTVAANQ